MALVIFVQAVPLGFPMIVHCNPLVTELVVAYVRARSNPIGTPEVLNTEDEPSVAAAIDVQEVGILV